MRKYYHIFLQSLVLAYFIFPSSLLAQNFTSSSASAKVTDRDNNGYANIGDLINLRITADNIPSDSINAAVIFQYYGATDTLYLTKSGGSGPGNTGNGVVFTNPGGNVIQEKTVGTGLNSRRASAATSSSDGIFRFILYKRLGAAAGPGSKSFVDFQNSILVGEGASSVTFKDTVDNERPQTPATKSVALTTTQGNFNVANIGDQLKFTVSEAGTGGPLSRVVLLFSGGGNQIQPFVDINQSPLATASVSLGNVGFDGFALTVTPGSGFINMTKNGPSWETTVTLVSGQIDQVANSSTGAYLYLVDQFGNIGNAVLIDNLANPIDNKINDLFTVSGIDTTTTAGAVQDSLTDLTSDGVGGSYIIGSKVQFKYTEPAGNLNKLLSVAMDLSIFGGASNVPMNYAYNAGGGFRVFKTPVITLAQTMTDAVMNTLRPKITVTDSAGNVLKTYANINTGTKVDLVPPGNFSVVLNLSGETTNANNLGNPGETVTASFSGLNQDLTGYRLLANNNHVNANFTATQRDLLAGSFPTAGNIDGGGNIVVSATGTAARTFTIGNYSPTSFPTGLNIAANNAGGAITFIVRDDAGNEATAQATMPFPVNNIIPDQPQSGVVTLVDMNGNGVANIGDSLKVTISGSGADASLQIVYLYFPSGTYGDVGQQVQMNVDYNGAQLGETDFAGGNRPDWIKVVKSGGNFVRSIPIINDVAATEFSGMTGGVNTLQIAYYVVDNGLNLNGTFNTIALPQSFDNQIPLPATIQTSTSIATTNSTAYLFDNTWNTGTSNFYSSGYITVGSSVTVTVNGIPADVDTITVDLRAIGYSANEKLVRSGSTASKAFAINAATSAFMDYSSTSDSARIPITYRDNSGNVSTLSTATISNLSGTAIKFVDRNKPIAISQQRITIAHTDFDVVNAQTLPSNNNGIINPNERIRIKVDVSNQADFMTVANGIGNIIVDLSAFGYSNQIIVNGNSAAPPPNSVSFVGMNAGTNYGYDDASKSFFIEFVVNTGGLQLPANSTMFVIRNIVDNAGNQLNPTKNEVLYQNITYNKQLDAVVPLINIGATVNSFAFSSSTDVNGDGIAAIGDGVQINAVVTDADSVFADLRPIGRGIVPMTLGLANNWSIPSITVLQGNDPQWASDNDLGVTSINIIAQDNSGNRSTASTSNLSVDNLVTKAPTISVNPASGGRFNVRMENGQFSIGTNGQLNFNTDMNGGSVPNTSYYKVEYDSTGGGSWSVAGMIAYSGSPTTFTSSQSFSQGKVVAFRVIPYDDAGNQGTTSITANGVAQTTLPPSVTYEPASGTIIGTNNVAFNIRIDSANASKINSVTVRARPIDMDPGTAGNQPGDWFTVGFPFQAGGVWSLGINAGSFTGTPSNGHGYQLIALLTDNANPPNTQTEDQALAANGSITIYADDQSPKIYLTSVNTNGRDSTFNGLDNTPAPFLDIKARGLTSFRFNVTDNLPLNVNTATMTIQLNFSNMFGTQTFASLINAGVLSINGNVYTVNINTAPYIATNPSLGVQINDGRGNTNPTFGNANSFGYNFQFSVDDNVPPAFYMLQPYPYTTFGNSTGTGIPQFTVELAKTNPANAAGFVEGIIEISTDAAFTSPKIVGTIFNQFTITVQVPTNVITLVSGTKYWVRAVLRDALGNKSITASNPVYYDTSVPTFTLSIFPSVMVNGVNRVGGTAKFVITPSTSDLTNLMVRSRRIDEDTTNYQFISNSNQIPFEFDWNTAGNYPGYEGYVVLEVSGTDNAGNTIPAQYFPVFFDNLAPSYRITAVNGDEEISAFSPMLAGDNLDVRVETIDDDVAATDFFISNYNGSGNFGTVRGFVLQKQGKVYTVRFPLPASSATNIISISPFGGNPVITYMLSDSVGNTNSNYIGDPNIGSITVIGNQQPVAIISNMQRFITLRSSVTIRTKTTGMSSISSGNGSVRFEIRRPNAPNFEILGTDNSEPYSNNLNTTNYPDGYYLLRIIPLDANNVQKEYTPDTLTVRIDNTNNGTTERAVIASLGNATIGGANITVSAAAGVDVGGVQFFARYIKGINGFGNTAVGWVNLTANSGVTNTIRNPNGSFSQMFSAEELRVIFNNNFGGFGSLSALDGDVEFCAVAEDKSGYEFYLLDNPGAAVPMGTGNLDDPSVVATTQAKFDFTAPTGIVSVNGSALTSIQRSSWGSMNNSNFNLFDGSVNVAANVSDVSDFGQTLVTLTRYNSVDPGSGVSFYGDGLGEGKEKVVASFSSPTASTYLFNTSSLVRGGLYEVKVYLRDVIGNQEQIERFFFVAGKPHAYVSGYNQEHKVINILGHNAARSARVEYSTDNGTTYKDLTYVNMSGNQFGSGTLDRARFAQVSVAHLSFPAGIVLFRVTASELPYFNPGDFALSRFASSPTIFSLTIGSNGNWVPTNLASSNVGIFLNHEYGDLTNVRIEVKPQSSNDPVAITLTGDNVPNVSTNALITEFFPRDIVWNSFSSFLNANSQSLAGIDGNVFGFTNSVSLSNNFNVSAGGLFQVFATNVLPTGNVDMNLQSVIVKRIASLQKDSVQSVSGNFITRFGPNVLTTNAGGFVEEDASKFVSYAAGQLDIGQIGTAYWFRVFNTSSGTASLRAGYRAYITIKYTQSDIVDANKDGTVNGWDELLLNVATTNLGSTSFNFNVDIKDKSVDTLNNTVSFSISNLGLQRYMLVLDGANILQQGSIIAGDIRVSNTTGASITRTNNFASSVSASFVAVVSDFISGINTSTPILLIDGVPVSLGVTTVATGTIRFTTSLSNLGLSEGIHTARFIVENNNGNRLDKKFTFAIDQTFPRVVSQSALFGRVKNKDVSFILSDPSSSVKPGAGIDTTTVFVDVYGTKVVKDDSSEIAYEIQQFIGRLSPSQLSFGSLADSIAINDSVKVKDTLNINMLKVKFIMVDNLQRADIDGYNLVVHDGTTSLTELLNSNIANGTSALLAYAGRGIFDFAQNQSLPMNFRVSSDFDGPVIAVTQNVLEKGLTFSVSDIKSGVDTTTLKVVEVDEEKRDSTVTIFNSGFNFNVSTGVLMYRAKKPGNLVIVSAQDYFSNYAELKVSVESENLAVADFHSYPNPFNPEGRTAKVTFVLSRASTVSIEAFDWLGRSAGTIVESRPYPAGRVNTVEFTGRRNNEVLANGVYFLRLTANDGDKADTKYFKAVVAVKKQ